MIWKSQQLKYPNEVNLGIQVTLIFVENACLKMVEVRIVLPQTRNGAQIMKNIVKMQNIRMMQTRFLITSSNRWTKILKNHNGQT